MIEFLTSPLFYFALTVAIYFLFAFLQKRFKTPIFNPLLWTIVFLVGYILLIVALDKGGVAEEDIQAAVSRYEGAVNIFDILLGPVTVALAIPLFANRHILKQYWLAILVASVVGVGTSIGSVILFGHILGLEQDLVLALYPRGVTTAIAKEIAALLNVSHYSAITVTVVVITGIVGALIGPLLLKLFRNQDDVPVGLALGSASHAIGTSKAFDYSSQAGAIATVSIITNGFLTVLVALVVRLILG